MSSQQSKADLIAERQSNLPVPERPISAGPSSQSPNIVPTKKRKNRNRRGKNSASGAASTSESAGVQIERSLCANCYLFVKTDGLEYRQCDVCEVTYWCSKACQSIHLQHHLLECVPKNYLLHIELMPAQLPTSALNSNVPIKPIYMVLMRHRVTRTVSIPSTIGFQSLHQTISAAFGWPPKILSWEFRDAMQRHCFTSPQRAQDMAQQQQNNLRLADQLASACRNTLDIGASAMVYRNAVRKEFGKTFENELDNGMPFWYECDVGNSKMHWNHLIKYRGRVEATKFPQCTKAEGLLCRPDVVPNDELVLMGSHRINVEKVNRAYMKNGPTSDDLVTIKRHQHDLEMIRDNSKEIDVKEIDERILRSIYTDELEQ